MQVKVVMWRNEKDVCTDMRSILFHFLAPSFRSMENFHHEIFTSTGEHVDSTETAQMSCLTLCHVEHNIPLFRYFFFVFTRAFSYSISICWFIRKWIVSCNLHISICYFLFNSSKKRIIPKSLRCRFDLCTSFESVSSVYMQWWICCYGHQKMQLLLKCEKLQTLTK